MVISSHDVARALELLDQLPDHQVAALRERIAVLDATVRATRRAEAGSSATANPGWDPVAAAMVFILWTSTEASLARSV